MGKGRSDEGRFRPLFHFNDREQKLVPCCVLSLGFRLCLCFLSRQMSMNWCEGDGSLDIAVV